MDRYIRNRNGEWIPMSDTQVETEAERQARTRYTGPVDIFDQADEMVKPEDLQDGRQRVDYAPYIAKIKHYQRLNRAVKEGEPKTAWVFTVNSEAVTAAKSRIGEAAKQANAGLTWEITDNQDGTTKCRVVVGKRLEGRGRRPSNPTQ